MAPLVIPARAAIASRLAPANPRTAATSSVASNSRARVRARLSPRGLAVDFGVIGSIIYRKYIRWEGKMRARLRTLAGALAACAAVLAGGTATPQPAAPATPPRAPLAPGQPIPPAELGAFVDGMVERAVQRDHIAGVTV